MAHLDTLAGIAGFDILSDIIVHFGPVEQSVYGGVCSFNALVSGDGCVMVVMEDLGSEFSTRNAQLILIIEQVVILVQGIVCHQGCRNLFLDREVAKGSDDVFEVRIFWDGCFDLGFEVVGYHEDSIQLEVWSTRNGISYHILFAWKVFDFKVVFLHLL